MATFLRLVRSIDTNDDAAENIFTRIIANTGDASWAETDLQGLLAGEKVQFDEGSDKKGPVPVMAYSRITIQTEKSMEETDASNEEGEPEEPPLEAYVLAMGDSDFISNAMYQTQGNKDLFLNTINFLADRGDLITVRPKQQESVYLTLTAKQGRITFLVTMILVPLFIIIVGLYFTIQRRVKS